MKTSFIKAFWTGLLFLFLTPLSFANVLVSGTPQEMIATIDRIVQSKEKPSPQTLDYLADTAKDQNVPLLVRERSIWALGRLDARHHVKAIVEASKNPGLLVRSAALDALARMRARTGFDAYVRIAKSDPVFSMRERATVALGLLRWEKAIDPLVALSDDPQLEIRGAAVLGMGATHSAQNDFREVLKEMAQDPSPYVSSRAKIALDIANRRSDKVQTYLSFDDPNVRLFSALYFHYHGNPDDLPTLQVAQKKESNPDVQFELNQAIKGLTKREKEEEKSN